MVKESPWEEFCDCPVCPCNVPLGTWKGLDCRDCWQSNHFTRDSSRRYIHPGPYSDYRGERTSHA